MSTISISTDEALSLAISALEKAGASTTNALPTAKALIAAERAGQKGHGLSRVASYCAQVYSGKVNGKSVPELSSVSHSAMTINANHGFAYPAIDIALEALQKCAHKEAIGIATIAHSHHFGQAGAHVERLADTGLIGLAFSNSPKAMAFWGSNEPALGTNPIAFASPLPESPPLVIDLALSVAARGKIVNANRQGTQIPEGWALDKTGQPTTDPAAALEGSLMPLGGTMGGAKGAALALMVEILSAALTGSYFGFEASSFFTAEGDPPNIGHTLLAINPEKLSGGNFMARMGILMQAINSAEGGRLPGTNRLLARAKTDKDGLEIQQSLYTELLKLAGCKE